ncbi:HPP family protein [Aquabacterium sp. A7-Y]|uniref:HPP family protein n=1 Tax=Aquabacterium sp. A7-Y TaxID=1349605 RepID=UPI00223D5FF3|nr:HPP family protein [Aquabacterium sp. A7-Y]MCW7538184.1 HPP family protein [Aquabacterium sp. A7-Y]
MHWLQSLHALLPPPFHASPVERLRACFGALLGLLLTGLIARATVDPSAQLPLLIAPLGASAVLLFAVPSSPLAQPWSVFGGNTMSALVGVSCARWVGDPLFAAPLAVGCAIGLMFLARCLHPPGGAVALLSVVGAPAIKAQGYAFVWWPVGLSSLLLVLAALLYHRLTGHRYPHPARTPAAESPHHTADPTPSERVGIREEDVREALRRRPELVDIAEDDLQALIAGVEQQALLRHPGVPTCAELMSRDVVAIGPDTSPAQAWALLRHHQVRALPVVDAERRVVGLLSGGDFFTGVDWREQDSAGANWRRFLRRVGTAEGVDGGPVTVRRLMRTSPLTVGPEAPLPEVVEAMTEGGLHPLPVVDDEGRLQGIVTPSDLVAALYRLAVTGAQGALKA